MLITQQQQSMNNKYSILVLVAQFWLSGLWILSLIFIAPNDTYMENTNFFMFITLGIGSLVGGYASDVMGRVVVFKIASVLWVVGSIVALINSEIGYIITAGCIGLLNNLTFVLIMENFTYKKDIYTIYVLIGWAVSQITLGILFYFITQPQTYFLLLFVLTLVYAVSVFLFIEQQHKAQNQQQSLITNTNQLNIQQQVQVIPWHRKLIPHSLRPLIGGCILMFVMQMFYYRTQFTLDRFGISLQLNTIVVGLTQLCANILFTKFINKLPRNLYLRVFLIILALLFLILVLVSNKIVQTLVQGVMRLFDTCIMIVLGIYLPELFDADQRGKGTNYVMSFGVLGSALHGIILDNFKFWQLIFFLCVGFVSTFLFKETYPTSQMKVQDEHEDEDGQQQNN